MTADLSPADVIHVHLNRGRDNAEPLGSLAERLKLTRRQAEQGVQELRLRGVAVCSGPDGIWLGDRVDLEQTIRSLRGRLRHQYATVRAMQNTARRMGSVEQQQLWRDAA